MSSSNSIPDDDVIDRIKKRLSYICKTTQFLDILIMNRYIVGGYKLSCLIRITLLLINHAIGITFLVLIYTYVFFGANLLNI